MGSTKLQTTILYESKLVRRNWLFLLFIAGVLGYTLTCLVPWKIDKIDWDYIVFASSLPIRGYYFLNLFQSLIVVFLICDITAKRRKLETREVLSIHPTNNGQFFWTHVAGIILPFLIVDLIFIATCLFINTLIPDSPANPWVHLALFFRYVLPTFIFVTGVSLFVNKILRHAFLSGFILILFFGISYAFLTTPWYGIFDFRGSLLPESFSSIIGFLHSETILLQRGTYLLLGLGLLYMAIPNTKRLPNTPNRQTFYYATGTVLLLSAIGMGYVYIHKFQNSRTNRNAYRETLARYEAYPKARITTHDITYTPEGSTFSATSLLTIKNSKTIPMQQIILFLNPKLEINSLQTAGKSLPFQRDQQAILIKHPLHPGDSILLEMTYGGEIDEDIYQLNIDDETYFAPERQFQAIERYGQHAAFISDNYTLLIPEIMWYPVSVAPVALQPSREINFTNYTLHVKNPHNQIVISQGITQKSDDRITFRNRQALTGLSLCMGNYTKRSIMADSISIEFYTYPGNDFYLKHLNGWADSIAMRPDAQSYWEEIISTCREEIEGNMPTSYPFKFLKIIEVPSSFLHKCSFHDNIQPEMVFFGERMSFETEKPGEPNLDALDEGLSRQEGLLFYDFPRMLSSLHADRLFSDFHWNVYSDKYIGINMIFNKLTDQRLDKFMFLFPSMLHKITERGLENIMQEKYLVEYQKGINLKISHLRAYLTTCTTWDSLQHYVQEFKKEARFKEVDFNKFTVGFHERFGKDIRPFFDDWYRTRAIPRITIKEMTCKENPRAGKCAFEFKVGNNGNTDGYVSLAQALYDDFGNLVISKWRSFLVKPGEYKKIILHEGRPVEFFLTANFSRCIPDRLTFSEENTITVDQLPEEGIIPLDRTDFYTPGEIIVDNEDGGFRLIDSAAQKLQHLAEELADEKANEYNYIVANFKKDKWGQPFILDNVYGEEVSSAYVKLVGDGSCKAEWKAHLPEAGEYEIWVYRSQIEPPFTDKDYSYTSYHPGMPYHYTIYTPNGKEEVILKNDETEGTWISLGRFTLAAGENRIILDDRGNSSLINETPQSDKAKSDRGVSISASNNSKSRQYAQLIVADAVKWVKIKE